LVTAGFIVEGDCEAILLKDASFINFLALININYSKELVINAEGKNRLYNSKADFSKIEQKISDWILGLQTKGAEIIFFLLDFDNSDPCFTQFKQKVFHKAGNHIIIAKQALEAWFLADTEALSLYFQKRIAGIDFPESFSVPFDEIKALRLSHSGKSVSDKKMLTRHILSSGFSLTRAAAHPNCPSAAYFLKKLLSLNTP